MRLAGKVALVTGAQQGIGRAIALAMAGEGADVGLNFLDDPGAAERVAGEIRGRGRKVLTVKGDVAQARDVQALVAAVTGGLGPPDILVNNAGVFPRAAFLELTEREWDHVLGVNLKGGFLCAQAVARAMVAAGRPGAIVNISSSAIRGDARGVHYSASKAGVLGMTRSRPASPTPRNPATATPRSRSRSGRARSRSGASRSRRRSRGSRCSSPPRTRAGSPAS